jgi:crotonobetainyl-CoA:carnitine CoA-transferase CaiB-like acyl-CoA transferase
MVWAGPYCGRLLAGLGAEVVKIEGPRRRDGTRPPDDWPGCSGLFGDLNSGKSSLVLDLSTTPGRDVFLQITRQADVVVENFSPRVMPNFGLDYAALSAANPGLIQLSMPAFESDGPFAKYVAYGSGMELAVGLGIPGSNHLLTPAPVSYLDLLGGVYGAIAVVAGLLQRSSAHEGYHLEVAQHAVGRQLAAWCPDDLWETQMPEIDPIAFAQDADLRLRGLFSTVESGGYCQHLIRCPWTFADAAVAVDPASRFGGDSFRILRELGRMTTSRLQELIDSGVVVDGAGRAEFIPPLLENTAIAVQAEAR